MSGSFTITPVDLSAYLRGEVPRPTDRAELLLKAKSTVFGRISVYFLTGRILYYCPEPASMVELPFEGLRSLKSRKVTGDGYLLVARAREYCLVLFERKEGNLLCFHIQPQNSRQFISAIPSREGRICTISEESGVRNSQVFSCNGELCTLVNNYLPLLPEVGNLTSSQPTPDGCLELYTHASGPLTLVHHSSAGSVQAQVALMGPLLHLNVNSYFIGLIQIPMTGLLTHNHVNLLSWSPRQAPQITPIALPAEATYATSIPNSADVLAMDLKRTGQVWIINSSGCSLYRVQLQPPLPEMLPPNPYPTISEISVNEDGSIIIWSCGDQMQAVSTTVPPMPWETRSTTLTVAGQRVFAVQQHCSGQLRPVPCGRIIV